ncbi:MAG: FAD-binding protein, partial [Selenomonadales bacterium]|nr:FAD-binding protein [Selenomonadales bacterium]
MKKSDVVVIGGGLSGLFAAAVAAQNGKKVTVLSYGAGSLTIGGGIVDIMGYADGNVPFATPIEGVKNAPEGHPYTFIGEDTVKEAVEAFKKMASAEGYAYQGSLDEMQWIPTAVGTLKPTALVPRTMDVAKMEAAKKLVVVDLAGLKDFSAPMAAKNLGLLFPNKTIETVKVPELEKSGRDMTAFDTARLLDRADIRTMFAAALKSKAGKDVCFIVPPILGTHASYVAFDDITKQVGAPLVECAAVAPSVTGIRLRELMLSILRKQGVVFIEKANVCGNIVENGKVVAVTTKDFGRQRTYRADEF